MLTTPKRAYRYPELTDTPDIPRDMKNLATDLDNDVPQAGTTAPTSPRVGLTWYDTTNKRLMLWDGAVWRFVAGEKDPTSMRAHRSTGGGLSVGFSDVPFDTVDWDYGNNYVAANGYTVPQTGIYNVRSQIASVANNNPQRLLIIITINGGDVFHGGDWTSAAGTSNERTMQLFTLYSFTAGQKVQIKMYNNGGNSSSYGGGHGSFFEMWRVM